MAIMSVSEFSSVAKTDYQSRVVECLPAPSAPAQEVTIPGTATPATVTVGPTTNFVRIFTEANCRVSIMGSVNYEYFPAGAIEVRQVAPGSVINVKAV